MPIPILGALFLAPWLTLITGTPLGGALFSMGLLGLVLMTAEWVTVGGYGFTELADPFRSRSSAGRRWRCAPSAQ